MVCSLVWESVADYIHMSLVCSLVWESMADCIHLGLLLYSFGLLSCVRVRCGLYPQGLTVLLFLPSVRVRCGLYPHGLTHLLPCVRVRCGLYPHGFTVLLLVFSLVWEFIADCIHMDLLFYSFGFLPCARVRCGLYPHGLTVYSFGFLPCVRVRCKLYPYVERGVLSPCEDPSVFVFPCVSFL